MVDVDVLAAVLEALEPAPEALPVVRRDGCFGLAPAELRRTMTAPMARIATVLVARTGVLSRGARRRVDANTGSSTVGGVASVGIAGAATGVCGACWFVAGLVEAGLGRSVIAGLSAGASSLLTAATHARSLADSLTWPLISSATRRGS